MNKQKNTNITTIKSIWSQSIWSQSIWSQSIWPHIHIDNFAVLVLILYTLLKCIQSRCQP